jgi:PAS domain S-box-containing protein
MPFSSQYAQTKSKTSITKVMSILSAFAACVFAIALPGMYYAISINGAHRALMIEAASYAKSIEKIIQARPDLWEFESMRLKDLISQPLIHGNVHELEIRNAVGELVAKTDFTESRPIISVSATFFDAGRLAGSIVVRHSIRTQIITTALIGILSSLLGCIIHFIFRTYPIRRLENTLIELQRERDKSDKTLYAIGDGVISVDPNGKILLINRVAESLVGMDASEAMGRQLEEVYVLRQGQENQGGEEGCILTSKGGNEYTVEEVRTPLAEMESDKSGIVIVFRDITERKRANEALQLQHTLDGLRKALNTTIQVMVSAVEARDPYTAGHQIRSADLSRAIATEMGLPQEKINGIRMAGSIHDIGKLSIPAEILSKPTKLSEIEFSLIKEHARRGFEMLKDVESPWPLAEIVYQHHERMDGSGYPRNLKGEEILIEARILTVSDVVEAMASHRPYRAGLGIDAALNEIEKNRGIFYDNAVADACLRLFREKDFQLEEPRF